MLPPVTTGTGYCRYPGEEAADADDGGVIVIPIVGTAEEDEDASDRVRRAAVRAGCP
jgi:hypothetical protein